MTVPNEYRRASTEFDTILADVAREANLTTSHQAYTTLQGVLLAFRKRLSLEEAIQFAQVLPPLVRALFVVDWDPMAPKKAAGDPSAWARDVQELRINHNISPSSAVENVAAVLRRHVDTERLEVCLERLPHFARVFWASPL
jgi:uncharacterized protein (DUF2267 family)